MIDVLARFVAALRAAGLRVSQAEAIDAARAVEALGLEQREPFRLALRATLVKTRADLEAFDRAFSSFFAAPRPAIGAAAGRSGDPGEGTGRRRHLEAPGADDEPRRPRAGSARDERATPVPADRSVRVRPGRLRLILDPRRRAIAAQRPVRSAQRPAAPRPRPHQRRAGRRDAPRPRTLPAVEGSMSDPRRLDLSARLSPRMEEALAKEVPRLIQEIKLRAGRRSRRGRRGRFWAARILRENVESGGVPFVIPYRARRPRRPDVLVLADVSWSVLRASAVFLLLAQSFIKVGRRTSVYLFVDRCVEATRPLARWRDEPEPASLARLLASVPGLDPAAPSDYGRAFYQAAHSRNAPVRARRRDTVLVVLGDARGNYRDPQAWAFEDLASRCRRVIWLNPEPAERWDTGDSVLSEYMPSCDVVCEARDLAGLARGVAELVRSL